MTLMLLRYSILNYVIIILIALLLLLKTCDSSVIISSNNLTKTCDPDDNLVLSNGWVNYGKLNIGSIMRSYCSDGYKLTGPHVKICSEGGQWEPVIATKCVKEYPVKKSECAVPEVMNGQFASAFSVYSDGDGAKIKCLSGKYVYIVCHKDTGWRDMNNTPYNYLTACPKRQCRAPPKIPHSDVLTYSALYYQEGTQVTYQCISDYKLVSDSGQTPILECRNAHWTGKLPACIPNLHCSRPADIQRGSWTSSDQSVQRSYQVGTTTRYECIDGYKLLGESILECTSGQLWSHIPPQCIRYTEDSVYCDDPVYIAHGKCECSGRELSYCQPFMPGVKVVCLCHAGYSLAGHNTLTCQADGSWAGMLPSCEKDLSDEPQAPSSLHVSTLAIVVATACSILGVLLFVMVIVVLRRHKPRARLYPRTPAPPPYTRVHNSSLSDHDRMALISCDARRFPLPSYEEATNAPTSSDYRPLPPIPAALRGAFHPPSVHSPAADRRAPDAFGSHDTVNVSMSDASTSVTVETYDSGASNPSISSRRAHTGSLHSASTCSIITEDAPLLDGNHSDGRNSQEPVEIIEEIKDEENT